MVNAMLSLVLPAYNEELNVEIVVNEALEQVGKTFERFEIIVVDDGSKDKTSHVVDRLATQHPAQVRVVHQQPNKGYGAALTTGFRVAQGDYLMFMDADRQYKPEDVKLFEQYIGRADIIAGYRKKRHEPPYRLLIGYTFNTIMTVLFAIHLRDINCGFKLFKADVWRDLALTSPSILINAEIYAKAQRQGRSIIEVGVNHYPRPLRQQSGTSIGVITQAIPETILLWLQLRRYVPPSEIDDPVSFVTFAHKPFPAISLAAGIGFLMGFMTWRLLGRSRRKRK